MSTPVLTPLPAPGLTLYPGHLAMQQDAFVVKEASKVLTIFRGTNEDKPWLEATETKSHSWQIKDVSTGQYLAILEKERHYFRPNMYRAYDGATKHVKWRCTVEQKCGGKEYTLDIFSPSGPTHNHMTMQSNFLSHDKVLMRNREPVATFDTPGRYSQWHRRHYVHVAAGMDLLFVVGVAVMRIDKIKEEEKLVAEVLGNS